MLPDLPPGFRQWELVAKTEYICAPEEAATFRTSFRLGECVVALFWIALPEQVAA